MALRIKTEEEITLKIDKLGRVLIPQEVRERLGLTPGTTLKLVEKNDKAIYLEPVEAEAKVVYKDGCPVIVSNPRGTGETDVKKLLHEMYNERSSRHGGDGIKKKK